MSLITHTDELAGFCRRVAASDYVTVDTEFMRERTYWPILCLVQVAGAEEAAAIDPLAAGIDLAPLFDLMADEGVLKVFHAARQDLEIFYHLSGRLPVPVFDTQIAAMVCGFGDQVGYETLVATLTRGHLDKASRFTDWSHRPLSRRQIDYALGDVTHLRRVYETLRARLTANGRTAWLAEEMTTLTTPATYAIDPMQAFRRIKCRGGGRFLAVLRELAAWRERQARDRDLLRGRILRDEALTEIAHHTPTTPEELARTRGLARGFADSAAGAEVLAAVQRGLAVPDADCPRSETKPTVPRGAMPVAEILKVLLKLQCEEHGVAQRLVASTADIEAIAAVGADSDVPALQGWRRTVFGEAALEVRAGRLALAVRDRRLTLVDLPSPNRDASACRTSAR